MKTQIEQVYPAIWGMISNYQKIKIIENLLDYYALYKSILLLLLLLTLKAFVWYWTPVSPPRIYLKEEIDAKRAGSKKKKKLNSELGLITF